MTMTATQALQATRHDPPVPENGTCRVCRKPRNPARSRKYAGHTAELDPFCSNECARVFYGNPLPSSSIASAEGNA